MKNAFKPSLLTSPPPLENFSEWMPVRFYRRENRAFVDWCFVGKERFVEPFFDQTIERLFCSPFNLLFRHQTPIEFLGELNAASQDVIKPNGFIFHLSRCGSTLVSQMLAALAQNVVLSEAPPINSVLRSNPENLPDATDAAVTDEKRIEWLRWLVGAFGRKRNAEEEYLYIKFDSWSTLDLALIERAFPDVPWVFLYRNPLEIIVSHLKRRGAQMIPGAVSHILPELGLEEASRIPAEEYFARVLARICESVLEFLPHRNAILVNYTELPEAVFSRILGHFRAAASYSPADVEKLKTAAQFNAKMPQMSFVADAATKQKEASAAAREASEKWVEPLYRRLENLRLEANEMQKPERSKGERV